MRSKRLRLLQKQPNSTRLVFKEVSEIKRGVNRYCLRAVALSKDLESGSRSRSATKIAKLERTLQQTLDKLEDKAVTHG